MQILPPATDLVIFDCDGVLVDSEVLSCACLSEILGRSGIELSTDQVLGLFLGRSIGAVIDYCEAAGHPVPDSFVAETALRLRELFHQELGPIEGIAQILTNMSKPFCVASSSDLDRVSFSLELTGLASYFGDRIYTSQMVRRGKPAPDLFLYAAGQMGYAPGRTLVIEDSVSGVTAAKSAGMRVWGFVGGAHHRDRNAEEQLRAAGAERIFDRMTDFWNQG